MKRDQARLFDEYLVASAKAGDRDALAQLTGRWHRKLLAHAWRLSGDVELAKDAAQAAWVDILRGLPRLNDERAFPAWAFRIVSRRCARQVDKAVRGRVLTEALEAEAQISPELSDASADGDMERLRSAIDALPRDQKSAIALFYLEEMSVAEVAVALDAPAGTVKTRLMHARRKLRAAIEGEE